VIQAKLHYFISPSGDLVMWQRFTERARRVVFFAQEEAGRLGENYVATEHILLALIRENDSVAARILDRMGISLSSLRAEIERQVTKGDGRLGQDMQLTPRAKRVIDLAYDEARQLNNNYIGTEHLLLGVIREGEGLAGRICSKLNIDMDRARREIITLQDGWSAGAGDSITGRTAGSPRDTVLDNAIFASRSIVHTGSASLRYTSLLSMADLNREQIESIMKVTAGMAEAHKIGSYVIRYSYPKSLAMIFEKPSLRTRVTFDLGMQQMGGIAIPLGPAEIGLGTRESVPDAARNLERWVECIMARVFDHNTLIGLRDNCSIPIINGLSDREHPCQVLADFYTILQKKEKLEGLKLAWLGDGNNVLHSLLLGCAIMGMDISAACPKGYEPLKEIVEEARSRIENRKSKIEIMFDPAAAVKDADVVYTDVWTSMGRESENATRRAAFQPFQVNTELMKQAKPDAIFLHCLPAHRGEEVTDGVLDGPQSVVFDQAENRLHAQKAVLALLMGP